jgi:F-type H+-transporting ATPase subunit delta
MSTRASAARYARALLDVVIKEGNPEQAEQDLAAFADLLSGNPELQRVLTNPAVPVGGKRGLVKDLVSRMKPSSAVGMLLRLLADRDRLAMVPEVLAVYRERLMDYRKIVRAEVTTAVPLPENRAAELKQRLADITGRQVAMTTRVNPAIVGGLVAKVGSTVYDGSVVTQLAKMKNRLRETV